MPYERGTFQSPIVPHAIVAQVSFSIKRQAALIETALCGQAFQGFLSIRKSIWFKQRIEHDTKVFFLIGSHLRTR